MHYTTVSVGLVKDHEPQAIDEAIAQGLKTLSEEIKGPVELVNVVPVVVGEKKLYMTVLAKPYQPVRIVPDLAKPFMSGVLPL